MSERMDPQARRYLDMVAELGTPALTELAPVEARRIFEAGTSALYGPVPDVAAVSDRDVEGVPVRVYDPEPGAGLAMLVYFHGGGWVIGSIETADGPCRAVAAAAHCRVASVGYRLAPEHRFPAAVEDAWTVTRWAVAEAPTVAVGGDSAGGNLAAVVALRARDAGLPLALQVLIYPVLDHDLDTASYVAKADGFGLTRESMQAYWTHYLGGQDGSSPEASPLRTESLAGVAPALVAVAEHDVLHDEGVTYAERLRGAGVTVKLSEYDGLIHGFIRLRAMIERSADLVDEIAAALREAFSGA
ncbi:MAG: alpha/beta hydrolase [Candidatus Dormibacteraeota bacterium]|nr:alpha/beta hydrolase [Candidatus Dormibacteraeota bacterium]